MFVSLHVENLALIETATLTWQPGLNVLSGETGAGKSMVIDAVSLLMGGRASRDYIRRGTETCYVEGVFAPPFEPAVVELLIAAGIYDDPTVAQSEELIMARELNLNGKSTCRLNSRQVPLNIFRSVSRSLINIHGQMEHMSLLEADNQRLMLDSFGGEAHRQSLAAVAEHFALWQSALQVLKKAKQDNANSDERRQLVEFQLKEIEEAELRSGEQEELEAEAQVLRNAETLAAHAKSAYDGLYYSQTPPLDVLANVRAELESLARVDANTAALSERLNDIYYNLEDLGFELRDYKDNIVDDPARLDALESRIHQIKSLCRKYNGDVEAVLALAAAHREELAIRDNYEEYLEGCTRAEAAARAEYMAAAAVLSAERRKTGELLAAAITEELHYLKMADAVFGVELAEEIPSELGVDEVVFMISPNPGEGMKAVAKIASGGEMSRIMLSIKVILAKLDAVPTLIFDEIDTGLGGKALVSVAEKLNQISKDTQAICVTHAPVVAAFADQNLQVSKHQEGERTITEVRVLNAEEKCAEICRMLAGDNVTEVTKQQALELIALKK